MAGIDRSKARLRGFAWHLGVYVIVTSIAVGLNIAITPETLWFPFPLVGWGAILAIHVAYVMGLFDVFLDK